MDLLSGELEATRTYTARSWTWISRTDPQAIYDGILTVQFTRGKTGRAGVETRRYFVQEIPSDMPGRCFLFLKDEQPDASQSDIYRVDETEFGVLCSCRAAQCHAPECVHADATAALLAAGAFEVTDGCRTDVPC